MDPASPPKRVTRARAAAKTTEPALKSARTASAAAKARTTATAKRKAVSQSVDADDDEDELGLSTTMTTTRAATRGRPRKAAEPEASKTAAPAAEDAGRAVRPTRGRPRKTAQEPEQDATTKTTRASRAKKTQTTLERAPNGSAAAIPLRPTRGRATSAARPAQKKTVKFEEPEKENIDPTTSKTKTPSITVASGSNGLRARPVRKPVAAARTTRAAAKATSISGTEPQKPMALSPKKITQVTVRRDLDSDDELALTGQTPIKPLAKSPIRPPQGFTASLQLSSPTKAGPAASSEKRSHIMLGTPARRPPQSPFKDVMRSPPKRIDAISSPRKDAEPDLLLASAPGLSSSLFGSPAKRPASPIKSLTLSSGLRVPVSPLKSSLLSSPAKRGPLHSAGALAPPKISESQPVPVPASSPRDGEHETGLGQIVEEVNHMPARELRFPGRLSAVLPRSAHPAMSIDQPASDQGHDVSLVHNAGLVESEHGYSGIAGFMALDISEPQDSAQGRASTTPPCSPPSRAAGLYGLREQDLDPYHGLDMDSEDELASSWGSRPGRPNREPCTPCPPSQTAHLENLLPRNLFGPPDHTGGAVGLTPLARQLDDWTTNGLDIPPVLEPTVPGAQAVAPPTGDYTYGNGITRPLTEPTVHFFEDQMSVRDELAVMAEPIQTPAAETLAEDDELVFGDVAVTAEDLALAHEAQEMSLLNANQLGGIMDNDQNYDDTLSEASQEYGDENAIPIDPAILPDSLANVQVPSVTPQRTMTRTFHTVSKVPLKAPDESTPKPQMRRRSMSISRLPVQQRHSRPSSGLTRNATVISYSPMKQRAQAAMADPVEDPERQRERATSLPPATPAKSETCWSVAATPARTPQRDVNPALLRGVVVFVDVHTSEGADASGIFVELLTQMGARCVKSWPWNPSSPTNQAGPDASRIGITHVVYKDGGKRTLEKVRDSAGVVQCVGVSWVLDCERENVWMEEAPYYIDTSCVPRGGGRRRKSMEPKALANLNGMLVPTPARKATTSRDAQSLPGTPANKRARRRSGLWERTPEDETPAQHGSMELVGEVNWDATLVLTPVPKTPAPEAVARFAANVPPETPSADSDGDSLTSPSGRDHLLMRTCPAKPNAYQDLGAGVLAKEKDEGVLMRLMAARRKSLQFAPKVGSPLAKTWE